MKNIAIIFLALALLLPMAACGEKPVTEANLRDMLQAKISEQILAFEYADYDGDGTAEAFAFVGEEQDEGGGHAGEIWFVSAGGADKLEAYDYWGLIDVFAFGGRKFAVVEQYFATGGVSRIWGVDAEDGQPYREKLSGVGGGFTQLDGSNFTLCHSALDAFCIGDMLMGRTEKPYWFFWDGQSFREHGGVPLAEQELRRLGGAAEVLDGIDGVPGEIFYRGTSGIINVNYTVPGSNGDTGNYYITLQMSEGAVTVLEEGEGRYLPALAPELAVYPKEPVTFA
ncbi:MAG: hypothetical protein FWF60_01600 [Oscillospiraceae bacterium]|nr:hypothetical protein [Oscillospiraceae bacterium]